MPDPSYVARLGLAVLAIGFSTSVALAFLGLATWLLVDLILDTYEKWLRIKRRNGEGLR